MEILVPLLIAIIIFGALVGGKSFGGTIRKGCSFLVLLVILILAIGLFFYPWGCSDKNPDNQEAVTTTDGSAYFIVKKDCQSYAKPNIESDKLEYIEKGKELFIENVHKYNYFYEISEEDGTISYVRKECLARKTER